MIPDNSWSCLTKPQTFSESGLPKPDTRYSSVFDIKTGGIELSQSEGKLNSRYYIVYQYAGEVLIRGAVDQDNWSTPAVLFTEPAIIDDIELSFDNLGRPIVFYQKGTQLVLWFYDSLAGSNIFKTISNNGRHPIANFDYVNDTSDVNADIMIYYVVGDTAFMRLQRDRFDVEYPTGLSAPQLKLHKSGMTKDNRFQLIYSFKDLRDGSLLFRKCLESNLPILNQMQGNNFEVGFTISKAPTICELRKLYDDYGFGWNGLFCVVCHSGNHQVGGHPNEEHLFTLEFMYDNINNNSSDIYVIVRRTPFSTGEYLTATLPSNTFTTGDYRLVFDQAAEEFGVPKKRIRLIKNGVTLIDQIVTDDSSVVGSGSPSRNRLRFGANVEYNVSNETQYKNLFPAVFTNMYTIVNGSRTDWSKQYSDKYIDSTPSGNPITLRKNGDNTYIFRGGMGAVTT